MNGSNAAERLKAATRAAKKDRLELRMLQIIRCARLPEPVSAFTGDRRQFKSKEIFGREWRFDFAWPEFGIVAEVHGGEFAKIPGGHNRGEQMRTDREKGNACALNGWLLLEFTGKHVDAAPTYVADTLRRAFELRARHESTWHGQTVETRARGIAATVSAAAAK